ncbi:DUF898 family protein [Nocardioides sp. CFH 31398]|uniref:DUF898 family protein n=1 Tax=Nocardioides sp. CFH 31398 TaxID=2919579 RepID=UPI001F06899E|nr:DUF898 family protein [Nocardioides sp. CFH 31398]MCH1868789.1 DUF898 family protein [Nocardioides sp. CFH 31398]
MARNTGRFHFDGGAGTYLGTGILALLITVCTFGICYPFALVLKERWRAKHSYIDGQRLVFLGSAWGLFGNWIKWLLLSIVTLGIYLFWVGPRIARWKWEHTDFDPTWRPNTLPGTHANSPGVASSGANHAALGSGTPGYVASPAQQPRYQHSDQPQR